MRKLLVLGVLTLILDACHSGAIGAGKKRGVGDLTDQLVRDLTAEENGLVVMCSALGHEQSQESNEFRHGLFTWAVLEALRDGKAEKTDGAVYLSALDSYSSDSDLTRPNELGKFDIAFLLAWQTGETASRSIIGSANPRRLSSDAMRRSRRVRSPSSSSSR